MASEVEYCYQTIIKYVSVNLHPCSIELKLPPEGVMGVYGLLLFIILSDQRLQIKQTSHFYKGLTTGCTMKEDLSEKDYHGWIEDMLMQF